MALWVTTPDVPGPTLAAGDRLIVAKPLTVGAFAPFGDALDAALLSDTGLTGRAANQGSAQRFDFAARLANQRAQARPNLSIFRSQPRTLPFLVQLLERHPASSQAFLPLRCERYLVLVADAVGDGAPDVATLQAFVCGPGQAVNYRLGVWHHPMIALDSPAEFAALMWEDGGVADCEEHWFAA